MGKFKLVRDLLLYFGHKVLRHNLRADKKLFEHNPVWHKAQCSQNEMIHMPQPKVILKTEQYLLTNMVTGKKN